jgi:uncharacterized protein with WD repeat
MAYSIGCGAESYSVVGTWSQTSAIDKCTDVYTINSDNTFSHTSRDEISGGTYSFSPIANSSNRHALMLAFTGDNQEPDCRHQTNAVAGTRHGYFVEFVTATKMKWYVQSSGGGVFATLSKK